MFWRKNKKNRYTYKPHSHYMYINVGLNEVNISQTCFLDVFPLISMFGVVLALKISVMFLNVN